MPMHELQKLLPRHFKIMDLCLAGHSQRDIAQALDMTPVGVGLVVKSPLFQHELAGRRSNIQKDTDAQLASAPARAKSILEEASARAAETHVELLDADDPKVRQASANAILDRVFGDKSKQDGNRVVVLEAGAIQLLQIALQESSNAEIPSTPSQGLPEQLTQVAQSLERVEVPA